MIVISERHIFIIYNKCYKSFSSLPFIAHVLIWLSWNFFLCLETYFHNSIFLCEGSQRNTGLGLDLEVQHSNTGQSVLCYIRKAESFFPSSFSVSLLIRTCSSLHYRQFRVSMLVEKEFTIEAKGLWRSLYM